MIVTYPFPLGEILSAIRMCGAIALSVDYNVYIYIYPTNLTLHPSSDFIQGIPRVISLRHPFMFMIKSRNQLPQLTTHEP